MLTVTMGMKLLTPMIGSIFPMESTPSHRAPLFKMNLFPRAEEIELSHKHEHTIVVPWAERLSRASLRRRCSSLRPW